MNVPTPRFTGIFIPAEILMREDLSSTDIMLLSWIDALQCKEKGGCFASNEYFSIKLKLKENTVKILISKLVSLGLIERVSFDGRTRILRSCKEKWYSSSESQSTAGVDLNQPQGLKKINPRPSEKSTPSYIDSKDEIKVYKTPPNPQKGEAAKAACVFGSFVRLKEGEIESLYEKYGKKTIDEIIEEMNDYCASSKPKGYNDYAAAIRQWVRKRKNPSTSSFHKPPIDRRTKNIDGTPVESPYDGLF